MSLSDLHEVEDEVELAAGLEGVVQVDDEGVANLGSGRIAASETEAPNLSRVQSPQWESVLI